MRRLSCFLLTGVPCLFDGRAAQEVAILTDGVASTPFPTWAAALKKKPRLWRGSLVACLLACGGVCVALLVVVRCGLCRAAWNKKEQALCQRILTPARRSNSTW